MIFRTPAYYKKFKCIASDCSDNCCIGWEIDIDRISRARYERVSGSFGDRLREGMTESPDGSCSFCLSEGRRCVFLNKDNLCDIIIELGEDALCQICRDHPRYFEWFDDGTKEGGMGLCCEEAARIILTNEEPFSVTETEIRDDEEESEGSGSGSFSDESGEWEGSETDPSALEEDREYQAFVTAFRDECLGILDRETSVKEDLVLILEKTCKEQDAYDLKMAERYGEDAPEPALPAERMRSCVEDISLRNRILEGFMDLFSEAEPMEETWPEYLAQLKEGLSEEAPRSALEPSEGVATDLYLKNIAQYFIWRYTRKGVFQEEGFFLPYAVTPVFLTLLVARMFEDHEIRGGEATLPECINIVKAFSKEAEYDEELFDLILRESCRIIGENCR